MCFGKTLFDTRRLSVRPPCCGPSIPARLQGACSSKPSNCLPTGRLTRPFRRSTTGCAARTRQQPMKNWIRMNGALAALVAGDRKEAARRFAGDRKRRQLFGRRNGATPGELFRGGQQATCKAQTNSLPDRQTLFECHTSNHLAFSVLRFTTGTSARSRMLARSSTASSKRASPRIPELDRSLQAFGESLLRRLQTGRAIEKSFPTRRTRRPRRFWRKKSEAHASRCGFADKALSRLEAIERQLIAKGASSQSFKVRSRLIACFLLRDRSR